MSSILWFRLATSSFQPEFERNTEIFRRLVQDQVALSTTAGMSFDVTNAMSLPELKEVKEVLQEQFDKNPPLPSGASGRARIF